MDCRIGCAETALGALEYIHGPEGLRTGKRWSSVKGMSEAQIPDLVEASDDLYGMPDQETLDAVNRGIRAAEEGRFVSSEEARRRVDEWISKLATPNLR